MIDIRELLFEVKERPLAVCNPKLKKNADSDADDGGMDELQLVVGFDAIDEQAVADEPKPLNEESSRKDVDAIVERLAIAKQRMQGFEELPEFSRL